MKEKFLLAANLGIFAMATLILGTIQTSIWFQIFGHFPSPALWIPCLIYIALFRSTLEAIIFSYLTAFLLSPLTAMPEGILMIVCLALTLSAQVFKKRIYWSGSTYFMMMCGFGSLVFNAYHLAASRVIGDFPLMSPEISSWLIQALLTPLFAPGLFRIFRWFDSVSNREQSPEASAQVS
jgi:hypothetical protein